MRAGNFYYAWMTGAWIDTKGWAGWEWTHGVGLYGIYQYYQQTGDIEDAWISSIAGFADRFAEGATTKNVNTMAPFLTLAYRFEETGRMAYLPWLESWAEWAMHEMPRTEQGGMQHMTLAEENHQQMWDDTLMMTVLPLAKIGKLLNRPSMWRGGNLPVPAPCAEPDGPGDRAVVSRLERYEGGITLPGRVGRGATAAAHHGDPGFSGTGGSPEGTRYGAI